MKAALPVLVLFAVQLAAGDLAVCEDFDSLTAGKLPSVWTIDGEQWQVHDGELIGTYPDGAGSITLEEAGWRDGVVSADVRRVGDAGKDGCVAVVVRASESSDLQFAMRYDAKRGATFELSVLLPDDSGQPRRYVRQTARPVGEFDPHAQHRIRMEARADWLRCFIDAHIVFEGPRGDEVPDVGRPVLRVNAATVAVDSVEIGQFAPWSAQQLRRLHTHPLVVAHRGFSWVAPENTLASYRMAIEAGAPLAECDVWLSADGVPVLMHDGNCKRTAGRDAKIGELTLAELKQLDAGSWKDERFAGERIPTLLEALELVKGHLRFVIEIKQTGMEEQVIADIGKAGVDPADVMIFCFNREVVAKIGKLEPRLPTTWLIGDLPYDQAERRAMVADAVADRLSAIGVARTCADPALARLARESGLSLFVWTADDPADMRYLKRIGVDGIITDRPDVLWNILDEDAVE